MKNTRLWTGLTSVFSFLLIAAIIATNTMFGYAGTVNDALGIKTSKVVNADGEKVEELQYFPSEYGELNAENLQKLIADTYAESVSEQEEGSVLLKNDHGTLPLTEQDTKVTLFGHATVDPLYKAASAGSNGHKGEYCINLRQALEDAGLKINETLYKAYEDSGIARGTGAFDFVTQTTSEWSMGEVSRDFYTDEVKKSWESDYNDVAIVMLAREGGEGMELQTELEGTGLSQLELQPEEKDLLQMIKDSGQFKKTVLLVNSGWAMELDWLEEYEIDACLWIGAPGMRGFEGVANILTGKVNPSGHLTYTYASNSLSAPAMTNASYNIQEWTNVEDVLAGLEDAKESTEEVSFYSVQAEGIYIGYKYYETRYEDAILNQGKATSSIGSLDGQSWNYNKEVDYPFGYGLSYSDFEQKLDSVEVGEDTITVTATVTNTGDIAGKSVVQVYAQTPYGEYEKANLVEKSAIQLLDFGKTEVLKPGESETLTIECDKYLLASYDYTKAKGYILSEGDYYIALGEDAHDSLNNVLAAKGATGMTDVLGNPVGGNADKAYSWRENFDEEKYNNSRYTDAEVTNQFDDADINNWIEGAVTYLSRNDWEGTYPVEATKVAASGEMIAELDEDDYEKPADAPGIDSFTQGDNKDIPLAAMIGLDYEDEQWETYLNQFTISELASQVADAFGSSEVPSVGKPAVSVGDGPDGIMGAFDAEKYGDGRDVCGYPCELILSATFNKDLLTRRGELMAEEALYMNYATVWMPGANLLRTPYGGRNFEYYSEDGNMNYLCEIPEIRAFEAKGVQAGPKHLTGNDQELYRTGMSTFFNEQAFREGALRGFEGALAVAENSAVMHGFNRLGMTWCSASVALCTNIVEGEWGFVGQQETDAIGGAGGYRSHFTTTLAAGTDTYCLDFAKESSRTIEAAIKDNDDGYLLGILRKAVHDYLYTIANSNVMNGYSVNSTVESVTPWWQPLMFGVSGLFGLLTILGAVMLVRATKKNKSQNAEVK